MSQPALNHGPGRYRQLFTFTGDPDAIREAAAGLLDYVSRDIPAASPLWILVAVSPDALVGDRQRAALDEARDTFDPKFSPIKLLVQVAAENADDATFARRLVRYALGDERIVLHEELQGSRHLMSRENFGYQDGVPGRDFRVRESPTLGGATWLLYQRCQQNLTAFAQTSAQARRDAKASHVRTMQEAQQAEDMPLLRRSFDYETYAESGLAFLASAPLPAVLRLAVVRFMEDRDELTRSVGLSETGRGLFVVPPDGAWLRGAAAQDLPSLPGWVTDFRRQHSFVHYEVSPKTADFLQQTFRMNSERLLEGGELRPDLQLLVGGIVKLLLGHRIPNGSLCYQFLTRAFGPKTGAQPSRQNRPLGLARAELADLIDESVEEDARSPVLNTKLAALIQLGIEGAQEAKEINAEAGDYVTFSI